MDGELCGFGCGKVWNEPNPDCVCAYHAGNEPHLVTDEPPKDEAGLDALDAPSAEKEAGIWLEGYRKGYIDFEVKVRTVLDANGSADTRRLAAPHPEPPAVDSAGDEVDSTAFDLDAFEALRGDIKAVVKSVGDLASVSARQVLKKMNDVRADGDATLPIEIEEGDVDTNDGGSGF